MAESSETTFKNPAYEPDDPCDDDDVVDPNSYDDDAVQQSLNTTQPFQPGSASTPYHRGEQIEMQTTQHEESGGRPSYEETDFGGNDRTPLLSATDSNIEEAQHNLQSGEGPGIPEILKRDQFTGAINQKETLALKIGALLLEIRKDIIEKAKRFILSRFPNARLESLVLVFSKGKPFDLVVRGPSGKKYYPVFLKDGSDFQQTLLKLKFVKDALGEPAASKIMQTSAEIRKLQKERDRLHREQKIHFEKKR